jgi:hypothetical protein
MSPRLAAAILLCLGVLGLTFYALAEGTMPADTMHRLFVGVALLCISAGALWLAVEFFAK